MKLLLWGIGVVTVIVGVVLVVVDVASTPTPPTGSCVLVTRIILPDICVASCTPTEQIDCTATTRPYLIFFTQAATCITTPILGCISVSNRRPQEEAPLAQSFSAATSCS